MAQGGFNNLLWYLGVVEDRKDPWKLGRIKVRCFDIHPDNKEDVPTDDLPWAIPVLGNYNMDYKPPLEGTWVFGFFLDGESAQHPMVLGVVPGIQTAEHDPDRAYSGRDVWPRIEDLWQPEISRLARGEDIVETYVLERKVSREKNEGYTWEEPEPPYNTEYPYNKVYDTESGHAIEVDDTPASERIHLRHKEGTFLEMMPNGSQINKIKGDNYTIVEMNDKILIKGNADVIIEGSSTVNVEGHCNLEINGDYNTTVHGDYNLKVSGGIRINTDQYYNLRANGIKQEAYNESINFYASKNFKMESGNTTSIMAGNEFHTYSTSHTKMQSINNFGINTSGNFYCKSGGTSNMLAGPNFAIDASRIDLNSGAATADVFYVPTRAERTLLGESTESRLPNQINLQADPYPLYTDVLYIGDE